MSTTFSTISNELFSPQLPEPATAPVAPSWAPQALLGKIANGLQTLPSQLDSQKDERSFRVINRRENTAFWYEVYGRPSQLESLPDLEAVISGKTVRMEEVLYRDAYTPHYHKTREVLKTREAKNDEDILDAFRVWTHAHFPNRAAEVEGVLQIAAQPQPKQSPTATPVPGIK
jgi:hypothetical protein